MKRTFYLVGFLVSVLYVLNPTAGIFELLPDNLPWLGNLDEAAMVAFGLSCWRRFRDLGSASEAGSGSQASQASEASRALDVKIDRPP